MNKLCILSTTSASKKLSRILDKHCVFDWKNNPSLIVKEIDDADAIDLAKVAGYINKIVAESSPTEFLFIKGVKTPTNDLIKLSTPFSIKSLSSLDHSKDELPRILKKFNLHWLTIVINKLAHWSHGQITECHINSWLNQFDKVGNLKWLGEKLLRRLVVMTQSEIASIVSKGCSDHNQAGTKVAYINDDAGKSWGVITNIAKHQCGRLNLLSITEAIENSASDDKIVLLEDGLFSATETIAVLDSLRGCRKQGRKNKVAPLKNPKVIKQPKILLTYAVACDFGKKRVEDYLACNELNNISLNIAHAYSISVLPNQSCCNSGSCETINNVAFDIVEPHVFLDSQFWGDKLALAKTKCQEIGCQLWRDYLDKNHKLNSTIWPDDRITKCGLGMNGLGLSFAFGHSVPKATLPLYWWSGPVAGNNKNINWTALFLNA